MTDSTLGSCTQPPVYSYIVAGVKLTQCMCCLQFISAIEAAYPGNNVSVKINNVMSGSVVVNETTTFLDGDSSAANSNAQAMALSPSTIFPAGTYGNVTTSSVTSTNMTNPAGELTNPDWQPKHVLLCVLLLTHLLESMRHWAVFLLRSPAPLPTVLPLVGCSLSCSLVCLTLVLRMLCAIL